MKKCTMCKEHRPYEEFCKLKRSPDGLYFRCRECNKQASAEYRAKNPDKMRQLDRAWYERNREKKVEYSSNWNANNREKYRVNKNASNRKRAAVMTRLPSWTTNELIVKFYEEAANLTESTGIKHSVDHIVPLNSKKVCGLHCHTNLRVIPLDDNVKKGNRSWPDMP